MPTLEATLQDRADRVERADRAVESVDVDVLAHHITKVLSDCSLVRIELNAYNLEHDLPLFIPGTCVEELHKVSGGFSAETGSPEAKRYLLMLLRAVVKDAMLVRRSARETILETEIAVSSPALDAACQFIRALEDGA